MDFFAFAASNARQEFKPRYTVIGVNFSRQNPRFQVVDGTGKHVGSECSSLVKATAVAAKLNAETQGDNE